MKRFALLVAIAITLSGCMSGNAKRFFAENKGYSFEKVSISFATPWGTETISADKISSTVVYAPGKTNLIISPGVVVNPPK